MALSSVIPITKLYVCHNVPLDNTYGDTMDFSSATTQNAYFANKAKYTFSNFGPVRMEKGIRIPRNADDLYDCNYIAFQNANFGTKWFYAFITKIEYVNINMSLVYFELDVMQTWMYDHTLKPCFVEREHVNDDSIGANIVEENIGTGPIIFESRWQAGISKASNAIIVVCAAIDSANEVATGGMYGNVYNGCSFIVYKANEEESTKLNTFLAEVTKANKSDSIVSIFMASDEFFQYTKNGQPKTKNWNIQTNLTDIDGYTPKNKKLFTNPYHYLYATNQQGGEIIYPVELFDVPALCAFRLIGETSANPTVTLVPLNYRYSADLGEATDNFNDKLVLDGFPVCSWTIDSFRAWAAQNAGSTFIKSSAGMVTAGIGYVGAMAASSTIPGGLLLLSGASTVLDSLNKTAVQAAKGGQINGNAGNTGMYGYYNMDIFIYEACITAEYAKIIDDYFSMYGYAVKEVKVPNITGRASWNYVKTIDCKAIGSVPFDDMAKIKAIYNNGITFWHGDYVGDYSRDNSIIDKGGDET